MKLQPIRTGEAPSAVGPYSQAVRSGELIFVSGQLGIDPKTGELVGPHFELQAHQAIQNLARILRAADCGFERVACVDVFLTDMDRFGEFNTIYGEYFSDHLPARAVIEVSRLPKNALIEIKCIACK